MATGKRDGGLRKMTFNKDIRNFINTHSDNTMFIDQLVVSAFVYNNEIKKYNSFIASFLMSNNNNLHIFRELRTIEDVINVFELAIPKDDVVTNGAIYTPSYIRDFIVTESIEKYGKPLDDCKCADIACGCGAFLVTLSRHFRMQHPDISYKEIYDHFCGVDICNESIVRTRIVLSLLAAADGEIINEGDLHLFVANSLSPEQNLGMYDIIVGNPPYVRSKHIDDKSKSLLKYWTVSQCGNADLYIPFFEVSICHLKKDGVVGFITPNSYFKSVNARMLRKYLKENLLSPIIFDFGEEKIFNKKLVYTCITIIQKVCSENIKYVRVSALDVKQKAIPKYSQINIKTLDCHKGWILSTNEVMENISKIESVGSPLGKLFNIKNGIATLANDIFIFRPDGEDADCYVHNNFEIEKNICRDIVKPNVLKTEEELESKLEKIIFPYDAEYKLYDEEFLKSHFPKAYSYLLSKKDLLLMRDKGECEYPWYAFGRTQAIADSGKKLLFPYMTDSPHFVYTSDEGMMIYCGYAIYDESEKELQVLKRILESPIFDYYIRNTSKPYSTGYYSYAKNYVKGFGVCQLDEQEKQQLLKMSSQNDIYNFLNLKYNISV